MPPPSTSRRPGTSSSSSAPVEVDHARIVLRDERQKDRLRAGRDDRLAKADRFFPTLGRDLELVGRDELGRSLHDLDLALLGEPREAAGQAADHAVLPVGKLVEVDLGLAELKAVRRHLARLGDHLGGVQERLGGDAADVQADPAERRIALDQHGLEPEIGRPEGRRVAPRPRAQHHELRLDVAFARRRPGRRRRLLRLLILWPLGLLILRRLGPRRLRRLGLEQEDQIALGHPVAGLDLDLLDRARRGCRHLHARLVGFERDHRVLGGEPVARLDVDLDHLDVLEVADVRDLDLGRRHRLVSPQSTSRRTSSSTWQRWRVKRAASAPSTTRWS